STVLVTAQGMAPIGSLPNRDCTDDVLSLIHDPLTANELQSLNDTASYVEDFQWLSPLKPPKNVFCVGKNYIEHVHEGARAEGLESAHIPDSPIWFTKPHTALVGHQQNICVDPAFTEELDYEAELAVIISETVKNLEP